MVKDELRPTDNVKESLIFQYAKKLHVRMRQRRPFGQC